MTNIKEVIEIALNDGYAVKRYKVKSIEVGRTLITVYYFDMVLNVEDLIQFSF